MKALAKKINSLLLILLLSFSQLAGIQAFNQWQFEESPQVTIDSSKPSGEFFLTEENAVLHQDLFILPEMEEEEEETRHTNFKKVLDNLIQHMHLTNWCLANQQYAQAELLSSHGQFTHGNRQAWISVFRI